jgi:hypothetical protein
MQEPMKLSGVMTWRRVIAWLRTPAGTPGSSGVSVAVDPTVAEATAYGRPNMLRLGIADKPEAAESLHDSVKQALGGRLKSC